MSNEVENNEVVLVDLEETRILNRNSSGFVTMWMIALTAPMVMGGVLIIVNLGFGNLGRIILGCMVAVLFFPLVIWLIREPFYRPRRNRILEQIRKRGVATLPVGTKISVSYSYETTEKFYTSQGTKTTQYVGGVKVFEYENLNTHKRNVQNNFKHIGVVTKIREKKFIYTYEEDGIKIKSKMDFASLDGISYHVRKL